MKQKPLRRLPARPDGSIEGRRELIRAYRNAAGARAETGRATAMLNFHCPETREGGPLYAGRALLMGGPTKAAGERR